MSHPRILAIIASVITLAVMEININQNATLTRAATTVTNLGIWISPSELASIPITGEKNCLTGSACATAWNNLKTKACGTWVTPNLADQTKTHAAYVMAGALVYVRQGDTACSGTPALRDKVRDAIIAAKRTMDEDIPGLEYNNPGTRTLGVGRQLAGYVIAADLINLPTAPLAPGETLQADDEFRPWLSAIRDVEFPNSNATYGKSLRKTYENWAHNWSSHAGATMIAIARYLTVSPGDPEDQYVARADTIFRSYGVRGVYPSDTWNGGTYFGQTNPTNPGKCTGNCLDEWKCDVANWTALSPSCVKGPDADGDTGNVDGAFIEDVNRGIESDASCTNAGQVGFFWNGGAEAMSSTTIPYNCGMQYEWSSIIGLFAQAEMLYRAGYDSYNHNDQQLKRLMDFMVRVGWNQHYASTQSPVWIANYRYGTTYPSVTPLTSPNYSYGWTDWTHGGYKLAPDPDIIAPAAVSNLQFQ